MDEKMAIETGAVGAAMAAKYGVIPKLAAMFCAAAGGAGIIAAYHPETRSETWWRALGAGIFGVPMGIAACTALAYYVPWIFTGRTLDDLGVIAAVLFVVGALFWGIVGALQGLSKKISANGAGAIAGKLGIEDKNEAHP